MDHLGRWDLLRVPQLGEDVRRGRVEREGPAEGVELGVEEGGDGQVAEDRVGLEPDGLEGCWLGCTSGAAELREDCWSAPDVDEQAEEQERSQRTSSASSD